MKGESVTASYKACMLENGVEVQVPPFVKQGDTVLVNTADGTFAGRA
jgi:elongation factor P